VIGNEACSDGKMGDKISYKVDRQLVMNIRMKVIVLVVRVIL
jgi:hypothetical protein